MTCGITSTHLTSHSQRLRWPSSLALEAQRIHGWGGVHVHGTHSSRNRHVGAGRRRLQGLPRVTGAAARGASGDRGWAETIPFVRNPEVPRTDLLLRLSLLPFAGTLRKVDPAPSALVSGAGGQPDYRLPCEATVVSAARTGRDAATGAFGPPIVSAAGADRRLSRLRSRERDGNISRSSQGHLTPAWGVSA